jgi:hypothetical protein
MMHSSQVIREQTDLHNSNATAVDKASSCDSSLRALTAQKGGCAAFCSNDIWSQGRPACQHVAKKEVDAGLQRTWLAENVPCSCFLGQPCAAQAVSPVDLVSQAGAEIIIDAACTIQQKLARIIFVLSILLYYPAYVFNRLVCCACRAVFTSATC